MGPRQLLCEQSGRLPPCDVGYPLEYGVTMLLHGARQGTIRNGKRLKSRGLARTRNTRTRTHTRT